MRRYIIAVFLFSILGCKCHQKSNTGKVKPVDSVVTNNTEQKTISNNNDSAIMSLTKEILVSLKNKDYKHFADFIHPVEGARFSPYGYIDTTRDVTLTSSLFLKKLEDHGKISWGSYDGTGDEILLSVEQYFKEFVYNKDFLQAEKTSLNKMIGTGNSLNNLETIYKDAAFTESYFSGFEKKYEGMDWCCLRLVYKNYKGDLYLIGVVHDQWTI